MRVGRDGGHEPRLADDLAAAELRTAPDAVDDVDGFLTADSDAGVHVQRGVGVGPLVSGGGECEREGEDVVRVGIEIPGAHDRDLVDGDLVIGPGPISTLKSWPVRSLQGRRYVISAASVGGLRTAGW